MAELVLHHYDASPFSEKVRTALGIKGLAWRDVQIPDVMPKPEYTPLTGGYRRTPSLQIGADVWCDSAAILAELERRFPQPSLHPAGDRGLAQALGFWSDRPFFMAAVTLVFGAAGEAVSRRFIEDRAHMAGNFDVARMREARPVMREQYRAHLGFLDQQLADGRPFVTGDAPGLADLHPWHVIWFLRRAAPSEAGLIDGFSRIIAWEARMAAIGHGEPQAMSAADALEIARDSIPDTLPEEDPGEPGGLHPGQRVEMAPDDYGRDLVAGEVVASNAGEIALLRRDPDLGEVVVHFPRAGFVVYPRGETRGHG
ncbi:MAG: glutathione S-transferase family protein [Gammaproteobacteria bacterium]|nr:glutathione S-transferase family protein [Gammaproteobacteria bacterium]